MDSNSYDTPLPPSSDVRRKLVDDDTDSRPHPVLRFLTLLLVVFGAYFGVGGLFARIEPEELVAAIVVDVLVGVAIIAIFALNSRAVLSGCSGFRRFVPVLVVASMCSGTLIGWQCLTLHMRYRAIELLRQREEQQSPDAESVGGSRETRHTAPP